MVEDGKTGFIAKNPFEKLNDVVGKLNSLEEEAVESLFNKTEELILKNNLRGKMSKNCEEIVKKGKFSIDYRNKRLKEIYLEALK